MDTAQETILSFFQAIESEKAVELLNTYRGVPITGLAEAISISQGYAVFSVNEVQAACIALEGKTYARCRNLAGIYQATALAVDVLACQVAAAEFVHVGQSIGKRLTERVQPKEPLDVEVWAGEQVVRGKVADISTSGVGIFTFVTYMYGSLPLQKGVQVKVDVNLPPGQALRVDGLVMSVTHSTGTVLHRLGIKLLPDAVAEQRVSEYMEYRKQEALAELNSIYRVMVQKQESGKPTFSRVDCGS